MLGKNSTIRRRDGRYSIQIQLEKEKSKIHLYSIWGVAQLGSEKIIVMIAGCQLGIDCKDSHRQES